MTGTKSIIIDTNIIIELFDGDKRIADYLNQMENLYVPTIVLGELYLGVYLSNDEFANLNQVDYLLTLCEVLTISTETALNFGKLKATLRKKGRPIPENDIWIAALSLQYNLPVITNDKHFDGIEGLKAINII